LRSMTGQMPDDARQDIFRTMQRACWIAPRMHAPPDLLRQSPGSLAQSEPVDHSMARPDPGPKKHCATSRAEHSEFHPADWVVKNILRIGQK
jgi:hypothetical protein